MMQRHGRVVIKTGIISYKDKVEVEDIFVLYLCYTKGDIKWEIRKGRQNTKLLRGKTD